MSRIAGIHHKDASCRTGLFTDMLAALHLNAGWQSDTASAGKASFGWCGRHGPNCAETQGVIAVLDGTIYNRSELGWARNDAALLAELYVRDGLEKALDRINGDFAAAVYDPRIDTLWLARDRFGLKPMYYVSDSDYFAFASQPRALLNLPGVTREVNQQFVALFAASHYRYFDNAPEQSPYADVAQVPAAHLLRLSGGKLTKRAYWSLRDLPDFPEDESDLAEQYRALLLDAVSLRVRAARRPAFTLSGGMDSSSVLASAVHTAGVKQHAFSTVYADKTYDESDEIRSMLDETVAEWHRVEIGTPQVFDLVERMIEVHDEPVATATWLSHFLLCKEAAEQGFGGLFGGLGGDELNAGEYEHFLYHFADLRAEGHEEELAEEVRMWIHYHDHPIFQKNAGVMEAGLKRLTDPARPGVCRPDRSRLGRYAEALNPGYFALDAFEPVTEHPFRSYLKNRTYQDLTRETIPCCARAEDRQTAAFDLDNFLPFFDHRLVEFMFRVPGTLKFRNGVTKHLLRKAMGGVLPEETRTRVKKTGWNAPAHVWFSDAGKVRLMDLVHSRAFRERGIYDVDAVLRIVDDHERIVTSGTAEDNHMMFLWQLVNLELWLSRVNQHSPVQVDAID